MGHPSRLLNFENSIPSDYQLNQLSNNQEPASRLLITGLIIRSQLNNQPTLVFTMLLMRGLVEEPG